MSGMSANCVSAKRIQLKRHYETRHKSQYEQYDGYARIAVVKGKYYKLMTNFRKTNLSDKKASYEVSLILAKNGKDFRDREIVKKCAIFCLLFVRADVAVCGPRINIQKIIWPATLSTSDHPDLAQCGQGLATAAMLLRSSKVCCLINF